MRNGSGVGAALAAAACLAATPATPTPVAAHDAGPHVLMQHCVEFRTESIGEEGNWQAQYIITNNCMKPVLVSWCWRTADAEPIADPILGVRRNDHFECIDTTQAEVHFAIGGDPWSPLPPGATTSYSTTNGHQDFGAGRWSACEQDDASLVGYLAARDFCGLHWTVATLVHGHFDHEMEIGRPQWGMRAAEVQPVAP